MYYLFCSTYAKMSVEKNGLNAGLELVEKKYGQPV
jgi:putative component of membrane protein insertase Oxa1/YidC/SpoIIIJ protein YidD